MTLDGPLAITGGRVREGHRVASGGNRDPRFPDGTILLQLPWLRERVPGFAAWIGEAHPGTINLVLPGRVRLLRPEIVVGGVPWTPLFAPETFFLSRALLDHGARVYPVFLYIPDPAAKPDHPQAPDTLELLGPFVPGLAYGAAVRLRYRPEAIAIVTAGD